MGVTVGLPFGSDLPNSFEEIYVSGDVLLVPPIIIDLDGDGVELDMSTGSSFRMDMDDDGYIERTAWAGNDDGVLIFDIGNDGQITETREFAFAEWTADAYDTDLDALAAEFDTNNDGVLDSNDDNWEQFKIWRDANGNGEVDAGEMQSLAVHGIASFELERIEGTEVEFSDGSQLHGLFDITKTDGSTVAGGDMAFAYSSQGIRETVDSAGNTVYEVEGDETLKFRKFSDAETNYTLGSDDKQWFGAEGNDRNNTIDASKKTDGVILDGGLGNDTLKGGKGNDTLIGADTSYGGDGDDVLAGNEGNDAMHGGKGDDVIFSDGDSWYKTGANGNGYANVSGGEGIDTAIVGEDQALNTSNIDFYGFENVIAGDNNDSIRATDNDVDHYFAGNGGNDTLKGAGGNDTYYFNSGDGADTIFDEAVGEDLWITFVEGEYNELVIPGTITYIIDGRFNLTSGEDYTVFGDYFEIDSDMTLSEYVETIVDGEEEREIYENMLSQGIEFKIDGEDDSIVVSWFNFVRDFVGQDAWGGSDRIAFGEEISTSNLNFNQTGDDLIITFDGEASDKITINDWTNTGYQIEALTFADGSTVLINEVENFTKSQGTSKNDLIEANASTYDTKGGDGNDVIFGSSGNDRLHGGKGDDQLIGGSGQDYLFGNAGNDWLHGGNGQDHIFGGDGHDTIYLGHGVRQSGVGAQIAKGQAGNDTYDVWTGIGAAHIGYEAAGDGDDTVRFRNTDISDWDIYAHASLDDTLVFNRIGDDDDLVLVRNASEIENWEFVEGTDYETSDIFAVSKNICIVL